MQILHIVDTLEVGGAEVLVSQLCRLQRARGYRPRIHCLLKKGSLAAPLERDGIAVTLSPPGRARRFLDLLRTLTQDRPDVVHFHNANAAIQAALPAALARVPARVVTRHGLVPPGQFRSREIKFWVAARFCHRVVAVCRTAFDNLLQGPGAIPKKLRTIYNGAAPAVLGLTCPPKHGFTLVTVARLSEVKNHAGLLRAVAAAKDQVEHLRLLVIGDGPLREDLKSLADKLGLNGIVEFLGERSDVGSWLQSSDVFVLPSNSEGLPISVLEAMAAGLPLLVTAVGGMTEMVELASGGVAIPPGDVQALTQAIVDLWRSRAALPGMGEANRRAYESHLTLEKMADGYDQLYREATQKA